MASHHGAIVTESIILSRIQLVSAGKLAASPTTDNCRNIASQMNERAQEIRSGLPSDLDSLPRLAGFRLRGIAMTRLETFIDAAFAFAITMLVIATQQIPDDIEILLAAFKKGARVRSEHRCPGNLLARALVMEPALRPRGRRVDPD
jgi:hypothetical protein